MLVAQNSLGPVCPVPLTVRGITPSAREEPPAKFLTFGNQLNTTVSLAVTGTGDPEVKKTHEDRNYAARRRDTEPSKRTASETRFDARKRRVVEISVFFSSCDTPL